MASTGRTVPPNGIGDYRGHHRACRSAAAQAGSAAVETALTLPLVAGMLVAILEIGIMFFASALMEGAVREAARFGITGFTPDGTSREAVILDRIQNDTLNLVRVGPDDIDILVYPDFEDIGAEEPYQDVAPANGSYDPGEPYTDINGNGQWDPDMGAPGVGGPGDVVLYRVTYDWPLLLGRFAHAVGDGIRLSATVAVRNEPFNEE